MAATRESETAIQGEKHPQRLKLEPPEPAEGRPRHRPATRSFTLWPWTPEIALLRRGLWPVPRVGIERRSRCGIWRLRQWFDSPVPLRIDADLRPGRREILRSPIYRALVASRETPWTGHGRDFERLREYQPGDNYSEIAWKSTARRGAPVTRLFQWEQKQEVYFVVDQSRASASVVDPALESECRHPADARVAAAAGSGRRNSAGRRDRRVGIGRRIRACNLRGGTEILVAGGKRAIPISPISRSAAESRTSADNRGLRSAFQQNSAAAAAARLSGVAGGFGGAIDFGFDASRDSRCSALRTSF